MNYIHYFTQKDGGFLPPFLFFLTFLPTNLGELSANTASEGIFLRVEESLKVN